MKVEIVPDAKVEDLQKRGFKHVCEACCQEMVLTCEDGFVVGDCPDHMRIVIYNGEVVAVESRGLRQ